MMRHVERVSAGDSRFELETTRRRVAAGCLHTCGRRRPSPMPGSCPRRRLPGSHGRSRRTGGVAPCDRGCSAGGGARDRAERLPESRDAVQRGVQERHEVTFGTAADAMVASVRFDPRMDRSLRERLTTNIGFRLPARQGWAFPPLAARLRRGAVRIVLVPGTSPTPARSVGSQLGPLSL